MKSRFFYLVISFLTIAGISLTFQNCSEVEFNTPAEDSSLVESISSDRPEIFPNDSTDQSDPNDPKDPTDHKEPRVVSLPTFGEYASIAFEDNVGSPNAGDRDYNDVVFNYKVSESYNSLNQLIQIDVEVRIREKVSGNNHRLFLYLNGDTGNDFPNITKKSAAAIKGLSDITVIDPDGSKSEHSSLDQILVVPETNNSIGDIYILSIKLQLPELNQVAIVPETIDFRKYRFILQNHGDNAGIDISEINPTDEMVANDGYPLAFMIPTDWDPPRENQLIDRKYSNFYLYRDWLNSDQSTSPSFEALNWFH